MGNLCLKSSSIVEEPSQPTTPSKEVFYQCQNDFCEKCASTHLQFLERGPKDFITPKWCCYNLKYVCSNRHIIILRAHIEIYLENMDYFLKRESHASLIHRVNKLEHRILRQEKKRDLRGGVYYPMPSMVGI